MTRTRLTVALLLAAAALATPTAASAACTSGSPLPADKHAANVTCDGVHPGITLIVPSMKYGDYECGASFAFQDQRGNRYLTIPGSCYLDYDCLEEAVEQLLPPPLNEIVGQIPVCLLPSDSELEPYYKNGPVVKDTAGRRVGRIAYAVNKDGIDFALVRVDRNVRLDPALPFYGGPTRLGTAGVLEETYVYSDASFPIAPNARTGLLSGDAEGARVATEGLLSRTTGASVMRPDGAAIGFFNGYIEITGTFPTQTLGPGLQRAQRRGGLRLTLMTAPLK
ncbi:MAG TPA: hypothetical protein VGX28_10780 [Frankiaceae bacterium]|jgi:hypothetical protein|nr:hypothetical protein [Frankiaceae bacterium]